MQSTKQRQTVVPTKQNQLQRTKYLSFLHLATHYLLNQLLPSTNLFCHRRKPLLIHLILILAQFLIRNQHYPKQTILVSYMKNQPRLLLHPENEKDEIQSITMTQPILMWHKIAKSLTVICDNHMSFHKDQQGPENHHKRRTAVSSSANTGPRSLQPQQQESKHGFIKTCYRPSLNPIRTP